MFAGGGAYERFMGRWSRRLAPLLVTFARVAGGDSVLDAGCGTGALSFAIGDMVPSARLTGVDPSAAYVRDAQARAPADRMRFLVGDARALEFPDASFDKTLSLVVMNFVPDPARAVEEMTRVTRPGRRRRRRRVGLRPGHGNAARVLGRSRRARRSERVPATNATCRCAGKGSWRRSGARADSNTWRNRHSRSRCPSRRSTTTGCRFWADRGRRARTWPGSRMRRAARSKPGFAHGCLAGRQDRAFTLRARAWAVRGVVAA